MSAAALLDRLDRAKETRPGCYVAGCPICQSRRGRPLAVRVLDDGRVLLWPFCGHTTTEVLEALGLSMTDLFERALSHHIPPSRAGISSKDLLELVAHEVMVTALIANDLVERRSVNPEQVQRLFTAAGRITRAREHVRA